MSTALTGVDGIDDQSSPLVGRRPTRWRPTLPAAPTSTSSSICTRPCWGARRPFPRHARRRRAVVRRLFELFGAPAAGRDAAATAGGEDAATPGWFSKAPCA